MGALMVIEINEFRRFADTSQRRFANLFLRTDQRDYGPVVVGVHFLVEQIHVRTCEQRLNDRLNFPGIASFAEVRNAFDDGLHAVDCSTRVRRSSVAAQTRCRWDDEVVKPGK